LKKLSQDSRLRLAADSVWSELGDDVVILDLASSSYLGLDDVGAAVWSLLAEPTTVRDVVARLSAEYEVDRAVLGRDLEGFLSELIERGLVVLDEDDTQAVP
jgi:hypothetical protein